MREKYEKLAIRDLRAIAKIRGVKGASSMSKGQVIEVLVLLDETEAKAAMAASSEEPAKAAEPVKEAEPVKKPRGRKPSVKTADKTEAAEAKPASAPAPAPEKPAAQPADRPAEKPAEDRAKALIDEAFERQARLNPDKTPEELKAAYLEKKAKE